MKEIFKKYMYVILICVVICFVLICVLFSYNSDDKIVLGDENVNSFLSVNEDGNLDTLKSNEIIVSYYVDIKGEVVKPGVYEVSNDSRIVDVIKKAGGLTKNADTSLINLSKKVTDEMNIRIYSKKEVAAAKESIKKEPEVIEIIKEIEKECVCPEVNNLCDNKNDAVIESENISSKDENNKKDDKNENKNDDVNNRLININTATKEELMSLTSIGEAKAKSIIEYREKDKFTKIEDILNVSGIGEALFDKIKENITV